MTADKIMHQIIMDEQSERTLGELEKILEHFRHMHMEKFQLEESDYITLRNMNILIEKTIAIIYRICFEILPGRV